MPIEIHKYTHLDHALTPAHLGFILLEFSGKAEFFIATVTLPKELESLACSLYGPAAGDPPIPESDVVYEIRGDRKYASRRVYRRSRESRLLTVIAGPHEEAPCVLYTAFGGPAAPRELGDPQIASWEEFQKAKAFWAEHALATS